jgi:putative transcriptional regulator
MPRKTKCAVSSERSRARTSSPKRSRVGRDILAGLREAGAYLRGELSLPSRVVRIPEPVDIRSIRAELGVSQSEFAARYGFSLRTLQEWEQGRAQPDNAVRAYLTVIQRRPKAVLEALSGG